MIFEFSLLQKAFCHDLSLRTLEYSFCPSHIYVTTEKSAKGRDRGFEVSRQ